LVDANLYLCLAWAAAAVVYDVTFESNRRLHGPALAAAGVCAAATLVIQTILTVWSHRLTGKWPWTGWTLRSFVRSTMVSWGLAGPERFGSKPRHKVELVIAGVLAIMIGLLAVGAFLSR
jgi:hypothetical protein